MNGGQNKQGPYLQRAYILVGGDKLNSLKMSKANAMKSDDGDATTLDCMA